jgi:C4-dicarboxylate transporter DctQ subunit
MTGSSGNAPTDNSGKTLAAVDKFVSKIEDLFTYAAATFIFILMFFLSAEVIGRKVFNSPIPGAIDWVEVWMATFAFLGAAYCQRLGGHVRMEMVISKLKGSLAWWLEFLAVAIAFVYVCIIINHSFKHFMRAWEWGDSTIDIELVTWPSKLIVPVALTLLAIRLLLNMWGYLRLAFHPDYHPIAVPIMKTAAEVAREEIEDALGSDAKTLPTDEKR